MGFQSPASQFDAVVAEVGRLTQQDIVAEAKRLHAEVMNADPRPVNFVRHVDGVEAPEEAVKSGGVIVYDYNRLDLVAKDALRLLKENSPVGAGRDPHPGLYRDSHRLFLNLTPVDDLSAWKDGDEISITSTVEYSRVIEAGRKSGGKFKVSGGGHVYEKVAQALRRQYADVADIQFTYRAVLASVQVDQLTQGATPIARDRANPVRKLRGRFVQRGGSRAHNKAEVRWPTITINPAGSFMTRAGLS